MQLFRVLQYRKQLRRTNPLNHAELKQILAPFGPSVSCGRRAQQAKIREYLTCDLSRLGLTCAQRSRETYMTEGNAPSRKDQKQRVQLLLPLRQLLALREGGPQIADKSHMPQLALSRAASLGSTPGACLLCIQHWTQIADPLVPTWTQTVQKARARQCREGTADGQWPFSCRFWLPLHPTSIWRLIKQTNAAPQS